MPSLPSDHVWRPATGVEYRVWQDPYGWVARCVVKNYGTTKVGNAYLGEFRTVEDAKHRCEADWARRRVNPCMEGNDAKAFQRG